MKKKHDKVTLSTVVNVQDGFDDVAVMEFPRSQVIAHLSDCRRSSYRYALLVLVYYFRDHEAAYKWKDLVARHVPRSPFLWKKDGSFSNERVSKKETFHVLWKCYEEDGPLGVYRVASSSAKTFVRDTLSEVYAPNVPWDSVTEDPEGCLSFMNDFHDAIAETLHERGDAPRNTTRETVDRLLEKHPLRTQFD